jgi:DNA polymerase-1
VAPPRPSFLPLTDRSLPSWRPEAPPSLSYTPTVYLDCETTGLDRRKDRPVGIAVGDGHTYHYLPFGHRSGPQLDEATVKRWALTELRGKHIVNLNTKFDVHVLESWGVPLREMGCTFRDVAHSEALLDDHETSFSLNALAQKRLGQSKVDMTGAAIPDLPSDAVAEYAMQDVRLVRLLHRHYAPLLAAEDLGRVQALEDRLIPAAVELERNGLPFDVERCARWEVETRALVDKLSWDLYREAGFTVNPDSPQDMLRLFKKCGAEWGLTEKGKPSFKKEFVQAAADKHPLVQKAWRLGKLIDLRSKTIVKYLHDCADGKLWPAFHQLKYSDDAAHGLGGGTVSGRWSSSKPNGQNLAGADRYNDEYAWLNEFVSEPMYARRLFRPESGLWMCADKHQVELRIAAGFANAKTLLDAYAADPYTDFHAVAHELIKRVRPSTTRTQCKTTSFTRLYGGGAGTIGRRLRLDEATTYELLDAYDKAFPEWGALLKRAEQTALTRGYVRTPLGRRARYRKGDRSYSFANRAIQATAADDLKLAMADLYEQRRDFGVVLRATVHDELDMDVADKHVADRVLAFLDIQRLPDTKVPLLWGYGVGETWHDAK